MALEARAHLLRIAKDEGIDFDAEHKGILHFYHSKSEFENAIVVTKLLAKGGLERRAVTPEEIRGIEPALKGDFYGGFYTPSDFTGDLHKFTTGLAAACTRLGVVMRMSREVMDIAGDANRVLVTSRATELAANTNSQAEDAALDAAEYDRVVVCGGVMSRSLGAKAGDRINVYPVKGYSITVDLPTAADRAAAPWVSLLDDKAKIVTSRLGAGRFRVAGTAEFNGLNRDIRAERIEPLVAWCRAHFPGMSTRQCVPWAGLRPMMPDMLPRVMTGKNSRILYNTGHGHLGWTLSAATAEAIAALATARRNAA
jgi:D-amino-acid dehydrogenase